MAQGLGRVVPSDERGICPRRVANEVSSTLGRRFPRPPGLRFYWVLAHLFITYVCIRWIPARTTRTLLAVGLVWLALTLAFELGLGRFGLHRSWAQIGSDLDLLHGGMFPIGLAVLTLSPLMAARWRGRAAESGADNRTKRDFLCACDTHRQLR